MFPDTGSNPSNSPLPLAIHTIPAPSTVSADGKLQLPVAPFHGRTFGSQSGAPESVAKDTTNVLQLDGSWPITYSAFPSGLRAPSADLVEAESAFDEDVHTGTPVSARSACTEASPLGPKKTVAPSALTVGEAYTNAVVFIRHLIVLSVVGAPAPYAEPLVAADSMHAIPFPTVTKTRSPPEASLRAAGAVLICVPKSVVETTLPVLPSISHSKWSHDPIHTEADLRMR